MALPAKQRFDALREALTKTEFLGRLGQVLPKHLTAERMVRIALHAVNRNPVLLQCTTESLMLALLDASQLGLEPSSVLGTAYLVPYRNKNGDYQCQLLAGYQGLIELARRSGQILSIEARIVYAGDEFDYCYGTDSHINHKPAMVGGLIESEDGDDQPQQRPIIAVYAVAHIRDSRPQFEIMSKPDVDAIRKRSRASSAGSPWQTDYGEMARKTVVRRLCKYLPKSPELAHALDIEDRAEGWGEFIDIPAEPSQPPETPRSSSERIKDRLRKSREKAPDSQQQPQVEEDSVEASGQQEAGEVSPEGQQDGKDREFATVQEVENLQQLGKRLEAEAKVNALLSGYPPDRVPYAKYREWFLTLSWPDADRGI